MPDSSNPASLDHQLETTNRRFAHLHQHTQYSLLDGAVRLKDLVKRQYALYIGTFGVSASAMVSRG